MDFSFNAATFRDLFFNTVAPYLEGESSADMSPDVAMGEADRHSPQNLLAAMDQAIDVIARADADTAARQKMNAESIGLLEEKDITTIGQYTLDILEAMVGFIQEKSGEQNRELLRLSIPVSLWVARRGGKLSQIDMLVNSLAAYANEVKEPHELEELAGIIREIIDACDDDIRRDLEQTSMMRPWRILNLNYGIVATRSHNPVLIEQAYDALIKNLPKDARQFFKEGLQQMDAIGYPEEVREVVERYNKMWGSESSLH